jgi:thioredoxin 1
MNKIAEIQGAQCKRELRSAATPMLVLFCASWCGQCQILAPSLAELASELENELKVAQVNLDPSPELAERYSITQVPTLILFDKGVPIDYVQGMPSVEELKARLQGVLADYST